MPEPSHPAHPPRQHASGPHHDSRPGQRPDQRPDQRPNQRPVRENAIFLTRPAGSGFPFRLLLLLSAVLLAAMFIMVRGNLADERERMFVYMKNRLMC